MSSRILRHGRIVLILIAVSLAAVAYRKASQAALYFSARVDLAGIVEAAAFSHPVLLARANPRAGEVTQPVPTRLNIRLREYPGVQFQVWLPQDPQRHPALPAAGTAVTLVLPGRWRELEVDERVLAFGLKQGEHVMVDATQYPYAAEYRTAFLALGAGLGVLFAALGAWRLRRTGGARTAP
jgi:hypothetical protein